MCGDSYILKDYQKKIEISYMMEINLKVMN